MVQAHPLPIEVVLVHGIRTSATMWRSQIEHLSDRGVTATAIDLPGHGARLDEPFSLAEAFATVDRAVRDAATRARVLLVGHSMGGLLTTAYVGGAAAPPIAGFVGVSCTVFPRGAGLSIYRALAGAFNRLPDNGMWLTQQMLAKTLPESTRADFGAGGYALRVQDQALKSLATLDLRSALGRIRVPTWFVNGQYDQLRMSERAFVRAVPGAELIIVPRATHLVTAMRPDAFNAVLRLAIATLQHDDSTSTR